ncbi:MAG: VacJ family lipoprotein [Holosporaceae bacterium]|nr:MAG: VacJ family lipoprotein [Holosporaceae bacterium]
MFFAFNQYIDALIIDPFANMYRMGVPEDVQISVANVLHNASEPVIFVE